MSRHQGAGKAQKTKIANRSSENVATFEIQGVSKGALQL
jgi:hypothetical protein